MPCSEPCTGRLLRSSGNLARGSVTASAETSFPAASAETSFPAACIGVAAAPRPTCARARPDRDTVDSASRCPAACRAPDLPTLLAAAPGSYQLPRRAAPAPAAPRGAGARPLRPRLPPHAAPAPAPAPAAAPGHGAGHGLAVGLLGPRVAHRLVDRQDLLRPRTHPPLSRMICLPPAHIHHTVALCARPAHTPIAQSCDRLAAGCEQPVTGRPGERSARLLVRQQRLARPAYGARGRKGRRGFACRHKSLGQRMGAARACAAACASARPGTRRVRSRRALLLLRAGRMRTRQAASVAAVMALLLTSAGSHTNASYVSTTPPAHPPPDYTRCRVGVRVERGREQGPTLYGWLHRLPAQLCPLDGSGGAMPALPMSRCHTWQRSGVLRRGRKL